MWMLGCNNGSDVNFPSPDHYQHYGSFHGGRRLLRPLIPRPLPNPPPSVNRLYTADFFLNNHHSSVVTAATSGGGDQNKRESFQAQPPVVASWRWNPTPEQLSVLEELYRRGTRTPSADQIQHITAYLRRYGKIEGKNVFYWFQNHKARERQKRRRQMESDDDGRCHDEAFERKDQSSSSGANKTVSEFERRNNWTPGIAQGEPAGQVQTVIQTRTGGSTPLAEEELNLQRTKQRNATWQTSQLSPPPNHYSPYIAAKVAAAATPAPSSCNIVRGEEEEIVGCRGSSAHTLELFPLESGGRRDDDVEAGISSLIGGMNVANSTYQFFEFLPVKNR